MKRQKRWNSPFELCHQFLARHQQLMRDWRDNYGKPVRQLTMRNQSTKGNVGILPIFAYTTPHLPSQPLNFSTMVNQVVRISRSEDSIAPFEIRGTVFHSGAVLVVKLNHIREVSTNGPSLLDVSKRVSLITTTRTRILTFKYTCQPLKIVCTSPTTKSATPIAMQ